LCMKCFWLNTNILTQIILIQIILTQIVLTQIIRITTNSQESKHTKSHTHIDQMNHSTHRLHNQHSHNHINYTTL